MKTRPTPKKVLASTRPLLHCCETWQVLATRDEIIANRPEQPETWAAMERLDYDAERPFHLSWAPEPVGMVIQMYEAASGRLMPRVLSKDKVAKLGD